MNFRSVHVGVVAVAVMVTVAGCATSNGSRTAADDLEMQRLVSSMAPSSRALALEGLSTLPNDSFASVQFCNSMSNVKAASMSVQELHDLVMAHKTKEPASMEEVKEVCK